MSQSHRFIFRAGDGTEDIRTALNPLQVGSQDIVEWLLKRDPQAIVAWDSIAKDEYSRAFAAARTLGADVIDDLYYTLVDTIQRGGTFDDWRKDITPTLRRKGWLGGDDGQIANRLDLIFDTNINRAQQGGRWDGIQASKRVLPYLRGVTAGDERVRHPPKSQSDHRAIQGLVLPVDHWFWQKWGCGHFGFRCRCTTQQLLRSQAQRYGVSSEDEAIEADKRMGIPVFASPSEPIDRQVEAMTTATNAELMDGIPQITTSSVKDEAMPLASAAVQAAQEALMEQRAQDAGLPAQDIEAPESTTESADDIAATIAPPSRLSASTRGLLARLRARRRKA